MRLRQLPPPRGLLMRGGQKHQRWRVAGVRQHHRHTGSPKLAERGSRHHQRRGVDQQRANVGQRQRALDASLPQPQ